MEVMGSNIAACLTVWRVYLCQRAWDLVIEVCLERAMEGFLIASILMENFNHHETDSLDFEEGTVKIDMIGNSPRSEEFAESSTLIEELTQYAKRHAIDAEFLDGPDTNIRVPNTIEISMAAKSKDEGGSEDEDDEDEDDFGEEGASEDGKENKGNTAGGDEEDDDVEEQTNNGNNGSGDDEDDEVDEEEDEHGETEEEDDDDSEEEDEEEDESLHPRKKRKK